MCWIWFSMKLASWRALRWVQKLQSQQSSRDWFFCLDDADSAH